MRQVQSNHQVYPPSALQWGQVFQVLAVVLQDIPLDQQNRLAARGKGRGPEGEATTVHRLHRQLNALGLVSG